MVIGLLLMTVTGAFAQCQPQGIVVPLSTAGTAKMQSGVTLTGPDGAACPLNWWSWVKAWIDGVSNFNCSATFDANHACERQSEGNSSVTVSISGTCGNYDGRRNDAYWPGSGNWNWFALNVRSPLNAGNCAPPPENIDCQAAFGSDYYWNGFECTNAVTPIIISLAPGAQYELTSAADGVVFDGNGDGIPEQIAWTPPDSKIAFLAMDRDGDGKITSGKELFGGHTIPGVGSGFDALGEMAMQMNGGIRSGSVTSDDPLFSRLLLWTDTNHNGISEAWELQPASTYLSAIGLGALTTTRRQDRFGNVFGYQGWVYVRTASGRNDVKNPKEGQERRRVIWDVFLTRLQ